MTEPMATRYAFDAINSSNHMFVCPKENNCEGWSLKGDYIVSTDKFGNNSLRINALVEAPTEIKQSAAFGVSWGISFGEDDSKTEAYTAAWSY